MNLYLDIETTGLPVKGSHWEVDYDMYPYVLEIAWKFKNKVKRYLIYQEGRKVPKEATQTNKITTRMANDKNLTTPARTVYEELIKDATDAGTIIGHNIYFDTSIIKANVIREYGPNSKEAMAIIDAFHKDKRLDTLRISLRMFKKYPRLGELYKLLFKEEIAGAHGAEADMLATERCFIELKRRRMV